MKTLIAEDFQITPDMREWARMKSPSVNVDEETEKFCDHFKAHGKKMADWAATWRNWIRRAPEFTRKTFPQRVVETPVFKPSERSYGAPVQIREHPLFRGLKKA